MIADVIRREALVWGRIAVDAPDEDYKKHARSVSTQLSRMAGVVDIHGLAGLHGWMACYSYNTSVTKSEKRSIETAVARILSGEIH